MKKKNNTHNLYYFSFFWQDNCIEMKEVKNLIYIIIAFFLLILIIFFIPVEIHANYEFNDGSKYKICIRFLLGLMKIEIDSRKKTKIITKSGKKLKLDMIDIVKYLIDKGSISELYFKINIGIEDPSILGISVGIIWAIINIILGYFFRNTSLEKIGKTDIRVEPLFEIDIFEMFFSCIIKVNLVYIIIAYLRISKIRKGGDSIERTSYRRFDANYND